MEISHLLSVFCILFSGAFFLYYARKHSAKHLTIDNFLVSERSLSSSAFSNTFAASNLSLASSIIFFIEAHRAYGWLMGLAPMFYIMAHFFLLHWIKKAAVDTNEIRTASDLWYKIFPSKLVVRSISILSAVTSLMLVFVEIYVGSIILSVFLPKTPFTEPFSFFILSLIVISYVYYGGYQAIVKTDKWQLYFLIFTFIGLFCFALTSPILNNANFSQIFHSLFAHQEFGWPLVIFITWVSLLNISLCFVDFTVWQRISASPSLKDAYTGLVKGTWKTMFIFWVPVFSFVLLYAKGNHYSTMSEFLDIVTSQSGILGYIFLPLIALGFSAALFSTADTSLIAAVYSVCDKNTLLPRLQQLSHEKKENVLRKYISIAFLILFSFLTIIYYINQSEIASWMMPIMYAVWGQMAMIAPLPLVALYRLIKKYPPIVLTKENHSILVGTIFGGWLLVLTGTIMQVIYKQHIYSQATSVIAIPVVLIGVLLSIKISKCKKAKLAFEQL